MTDLVPIRVEIRLKKDGGCRYPNFNEIPSATRDDSDWSIFIDKYGGWYYDRSFGHADDGTNVDGVLDSPPGTWLGMLLVPEDFATEAITRFPARVSRLTDAQAQVFYEQRVTANQPDIFDDVTELQAIAARKAAGVADDTDVTKALDPDDHDRKGRRRNRRKTFAGLKTDRGIRVVDP